MNPTEKRRAEAAAERAANKARKEVANEILATMLDIIPDGESKRNGQILVISGRIIDKLDSLEARAAKVAGSHFTEKQQREIIDYLSCVNGGLTQFLKQMGLEEADGTP